MTFFLQLLVTGFAQGMVYALVALGFVIVLKCSQAFNVAQGQFVMIGGYMGYTFLATLHFPVWLCLVCSVIVAIIMGLVVERFVVRPMIGKPVLAIIMVTMGLASLLDGVAVFRWGSQYLTYHGLLPTINLKLGEISVPPETLIAHNSLRRRRRDTHALLPLHEKRAGNEGHCRGRAGRAGRRYQGNHGLRHLLGRLRGSSV